MMRGGNMTPEIRAASSAKLTASRLARQAADGIPFDWDKCKSSTYRKYLRRCKLRGRIAMSAVEWDAKKGGKEYRSECLLIRSSKALAQRRKEGLPDRWDSIIVKQYREFRKRRILSGLAVASPEEWEKGNYVDGRSIRFSKIDNLMLKDFKPNSKRIESIIEKINRKAKEMAASCRTTRK